MARLLREELFCGTHKKKIVVGPLRVGMGGGLKPPEPLRKEKLFSMI